MMLNPEPKAFETSCSPERAFLAEAFLPAFFLAPAVLLLLLLRVEVVLRLLPADCVFSAAGVLVAAGLPARRLWFILPKQFFRPDGNSAVKQQQNIAL